MMSRKTRRGFSLIEMLIATGVLLVAIGILSELADVGRIHIRSAGDAAVAQRICQNLLEQILCGDMPLEATTDATWSDDPDWTYSIEINPLDQFNWDITLNEIRITVQKNPEDSRPSKPFTLTRWIRAASDENGQSGTQPKMIRPITSPTQRASSGGPQP
jgi:prepilin-type N-terminal cleavage/methylation domain-containing protein